MIPIKGSIIPSLRFSHPIINKLDLSILFDISLSEAAKKFAKHFSCGSSVVKGINGKADHIDVQGDFYTTIADFILKTYPQIEANNIIIQS